MNKLYLDNIDTEIKIEILNTLKEIYIKYPKVFNNINLISDIDYLLSYLNKNYNINKEDKYKESNRTIFTTAGMWLPKQIKSLNLYDQILYDKPDFIGIGINKSLDYKTIKKQIKKDYKDKWCYSKNIRDALYHEFGHVFTKLFKLTNNPKLMEIINNNINNENISTYAKTSPEEFISELFSKYSYDPKYNELTYIIGNIINNYYIKFEDTELFNKTLKH